MDGERGDMPGKEELPILRLDAPVLPSSYRAVTFLIFFMPLTSSFFSIHSLLLLLFLTASSLPSLQFYPFLLCGSMSELCQHVADGDALPVMVMREHAGVQRRS